MAYYVVLRSFSGSVGNYQQGQLVQLSTATGTAYAAFLTEVADLDEAIAALEPFQG